MSDPAWLGFVAALASASGFFFFKRRRFDLLTVAYIGAAFYFSPMIFGFVLVPYGVDASIPSQAYWIASVYLMGLIAAGLIVPLLPSQEQTTRMLPPIAACCWPRSGLSPPSLLAAEKYSILTK